MTNIQVTQRLPHSAEVVWALIGDFGGLHRWHPQIHRLDLSWQGQIRTLHYVDGGRAVERLEARNDTIYRYTYVLVDSSLPVQACRSKLEVQAVGAECMVIWSSNFEALGDGEGEVEEALRTVYTDGLGALATALGGF
ncbi:MAG: SRPBCC family protein [Rhodanobacter sp.]